MPKMRSTNSVPKAGNTSASSDSFLKSCHPEDRVLRGPKDLYISAHRSSNSPTKDSALNQKSPYYLRYHTSLPPSTIPVYSKLMSPQKHLLPIVAKTIIATTIALAPITPAAAQKKPQPQLQPAHATIATPAVTDDFIHKNFGDNCNLLSGPPQFVGDLNGDGIDDLVVAAKCKNPMADRDEYGFQVADPYDAYLGYNDVRVTSTFASDEPERRGVCLLIIQGVGKDAWRSTAPKPKFLLINLPFKSLTVKRLASKKKSLLAVFMEEQGEGEDTSSVLFWDGKRYRYTQLGSTLE
jgi:hypothetical protein